ncbi:MAG: hypothetical protein AAF968_26360, partial [Pseudomonadota bacterium]
MSTMKTENAAAAAWAARSSDDWWFEWTIFGAVLAAALAAVAAVMERDVAFPEAVVAVALFYLFGWLTELRHSWRLARKFCESAAIANG